MEDHLNVPLEDAELLAEVELTTNLIIAATESDTPLTQEEIDRILGVDRPDPTHSGDISAEPTGPTGT